ncbi:PcfJ domain-containing protein [Pararhizobium sp. BT-229]|uniref:PcfJ domain-containing protein n=1 Tax=Pararhizobium sp. BT-229 TaxID=2986923 RepID=UPI0021F7838F|nr:PcfJ domain-containing protein [Pararhizobium sp. BT-229]MCV9964194.1 PcfJ domain-containing protein [Pararhizobium sp. BT-229]
MVDTAQIEKWMEFEARRIEEWAGVDILDLLTLSYTRVVIAESKRLGSFDTNRYNDAHLYHIADWLVAARLRSEDWLSRLDSQNRPRKLMKFGSIAQMVAEANKAMRKRRNDGKSVEASEGAELVHDCGDGFNIFRLTTKDALDHEGWQMGHCVGQGAYDQGVVAGKTAIFSLRDRFGKSHATVELDTVRNHIRQIKGKQNDHPKSEYMRRLIGWLEPSWTISEDDLPPGFVIDRNNRLVELGLLKAGEVFDGDLSFRCTDEELDEFHVPIPEGVIVKGRLTVLGADLLLRMKCGKGDDAGVLQRVVLPRGLGVLGDLDLKYLRLHADELAVGALNTTICEVTKLPERVAAGCTFRRTVFDDVGDTAFASRVKFFDCTDVRLASGVIFEEAVSVEDCSKVGMFCNPAVNFGDGTLFRGNLSARRADIGFSGEITCEKTVRLHYCHDVRMPDALTVGEDFCLLDAVIDRWPPHLEVAGEVNVADYAVTSGTRNSAPSLKFG